jgi:hypothetical protein
MFDYSKKSGIDHSEIMAPDHAPDWAYDRGKLWNFVEKFEKRKDAQLTREVEVALPIELNLDQQRDLIRGFSRSQFIDAGMVADIAIHHAKGDNPHAHILLTMREIGPDGFGSKNRSWNDKSLLQDWRKAWETQSNQALAKAGRTARIDHRTLAEQGIDRIPQIHIGPKVPEMERRGIKTEIGGQALAIENKNEAIAALQSDWEAARNERHHETSTGPQRGTDRARTRTASLELGSTGRPSANQHQGFGGNCIAAGAGMEHPTDARSQRGEHSSQNRGTTRQSVATDHGQPPANSRGSEAGPAWPVPDTGLHDEHLSHPRSSAIDRVMALASASTTGAELTERRSSGPIPQASNFGSTQTPIKTDRSYLAARRQLDAMGVDTFEVGIRDRAGRMLLRTWSKSETLQAIPWLKRENAKGADVYVRPAGQTNAGLILVDDLNRGQLTRMKAEGLNPASVTETSPDNFQAWVRVHEKRLDPALATEVAAMLATEYEGDPNSADWRHFGRLAGLTNTKPRHKDTNGRSPYVLAHDSVGKLALGGPTLVQLAAQRLRERQGTQEHRIRLKATETCLERTNERNPIHTYQLGFKTLYTRFGVALDVSKADYMIGVNMARQGFTAAQIEHAIEQASPELPIRKAGHQTDYVARTVQAIMSHPEVVKLQQEQSRERDSGPSLSM